MLDIPITEILIIAFGALVLLGPKEMKYLLYKTAKLYQKITKLYFKHADDINNNLGLQILKKKQPLNNYYDKKYYWVNLPGHISQNPCV